LTNGKHVANILVLVAAFMLLLFSWGCKKEAKAEAVAPPAKYAMEAMVVNLADDDERYLKISIGFELAEGVTEALMKENENVIKDAVIMHLSAKYYHDIRAKDGKEKLKVEIMNTLNSVLKKKAIKTVYFTELIAQ